jgi:hypothetical protein
LNRDEVIKESHVSQQTLPQQTVGKCDGERDAWLQDVEAVMRQAENWSRKRDWATRRDVKTITESPFGAYQVPVLLIHTPQGRLLLDPHARFVFGAEGRIDFCVYPSFDSTLLVKTENGNWEFLELGPPERHLPWSEETIGQVAKQLLERP